VTRHELIDGRWYLIKSEHLDNGFEFARYEEGDFILIHDVFWSVDVAKGNGCKWVEIDPELAFNLFKDMDFDQLSYALECARGLCMRGPANE